MENKYEIERDKKIRFHELGTLQAVTAWITGHEDGFAEWMKNIRRTYAEDRDNVLGENRVSVLLLKDAEGKSPARLGILDVGGATFEDVEKWSVWQDPKASVRSEDIGEETTQGNGGKAYMYKFFKGPAYIVGVKEDEINRKGFVGPNNSKERGQPGFMPNNKLGMNAEIDSWEDELIKELAPFNMDLAALPKQVKKTLNDRKAFTIVGGIDPINWDEKNVKSFIKRLIRHPQSHLPIQQVCFFVFHNGKFLFNHEPLGLEDIFPYPGFEKPVVFDIPEYLPDDLGHKISTTKNDKYNPGKMTIFTSKEDMLSAWKTLKPRWKARYQTDYQMVGEKSIEEIVPSTPGAKFIYANINLNSLEEYAQPGRARPTDHPLVKAIDLFLAEKIKEIAKKINDLRKQKLNESALDEIQQDNKYLNEIKNEFLPSGGEFDFASLTNGDSGKKNKKKIKIDWGKQANSIKVTSYSLKIARGFKLDLTAVLKPTVRDAQNKPVPAKVKWITDNKNILELDEDGNCFAKEKGKCKIQIFVEDKESIATPSIPIEIIVVKDIFLAPTSLKVPIGHNKQITAQVLDNEGKRSSEVLVNWQHDAENQNLIKISPKGYVFGNIIGKTNVKAWVKDSENGDIFSNIATEVEVIKSTSEGDKGSGFPSLLITDRDKDPETGEIRKGDPDEPALWQLPSDDKHNVWWLNLQSKDVTFAHNQREKDLKLWRFFHAKILVEMIVQVYMKHEFTSKQEQEQPGRWVDYKFALEQFEIQLKPKLWERLTPWILGEEEAEE